MKRKIALLLAVVMILSLVPMSAFAAAKYTTSSLRTISKGATTFPTAPTGGVTGSVYNDGNNAVVTGDTHNTEATFTVNGVVVTPQVITRTQVVVDENDILVDKTERLFVELPSGVTGRIRVTAGAAPNPFSIPANGVELLNANQRDANEWTRKGNQFRITVDVNAGVAADGVLLIDLTDVTVPSNFSKDQVTLSFETTPGSLFTTTEVPIADVGTGTIAVTIRDVNYITDSNVENDIAPLRFTENKAGSMEDKEHVTLTLPRGFYWEPGTGATYVAGTGRTTDNLDITYRYGGTGNSTVDVEYRDAVDNRNDRYRSLRLFVPAGMNADEANSWEVQADQIRIVVDPRLAEQGDVVAKLGNAVASELTVAYYGDYVASVKALTTPHRIAGQFQGLGSFEIREDIAGSLGERRTITLTLPVGAKWRVPEKGSALAVDAPELDTSASELHGLEFGTVGGNERWMVVDNERRTIRTTITSSSYRGTNTGNRAGALLVFEDAEVAIEPTFRGDLNVVVGGTAGAAGEITLATVTAAVETEINEIKDVKIGLQNQEIGDILITETKAGAASRTDTNTGVIQLAVPGVRGTVFAKTPKAEVVEGDIYIEKVWMSADFTTVNVQVTAKSDNASSIKVTDLALTMDRTAPEGPFYLHVLGGAVVNPALNSEEYFLGSAISHTLEVANVITAASGVAVGKDVVLTIGSTTIYTDGVASTIPVAPYIDAQNRTMVPVSAIGRIIGAEVDWNEATRTVLVTKDGNRALLTIGSDVMNVNGMNIPMRSQAVIRSERTFVPLRDLGVALGVSTDWDAATQTVTVK